MFSKKAPPNEGGGGVPSDVQAREKLVLHVYEYLLHMGAKSAATSFLQEIHYDKPITNITEPPGFLHSWWCVFWDLYCAAPERRDSCVFSTDAKAFHDYGFVNSGYAVNGLHGPNPVPSPLGLPPQGPDGMPPGPAGMGPPPGFFASPVPGPHMRPSPPQQAASQQSPHVMMNQPIFMNAGRYPGPNTRPGAPGRLGQEPPPPPPFVGGPPGQPMFAEQVRQGGPPHLMPPQRMPPAGSHHPMRPMGPGPNGFSGMRPNMGPVMGPGMPPGQHLQRSWSVTSNPAMGVSNGPTPGGPGTPVMPSPQDGGPDRFNNMMQAGPPMGPFSMNPDPSGSGGMGEMMMNGDGLDIKHSPASMGGLNGGTPGPGGPNSVPPSTSGEPCGLDYGGGPINPFQAAAAASFRGDQEAEIQKIKDTICEESKRFESGKDPEADGGFFLQ